MITEVTRTERVHEVIVLGAPVRWTERVHEAIVLDRAGARGGRAKERVHEVVVLNRAGPQGHHTGLSGCTRWSC